MEPKQYTGNEWKELAGQLNARQIRNSLKRAYRKEAKKAVAIARGSLRASGLKVEGNRADWERGVRSHIYSRGGGFLVTVKGRQASKRGKEASMHANRYYAKTGRKLPILMWAEDGTRERYAGPGGWKYSWSGNGKLAARHGDRYKPRRRKLRISGTSRGRLREYGFLKRAAPAMYRSVESGLFPEVEAAVRKTAAKCGFA